MAPARSGQNRQRSIIITGCSSGIGAYCAEALKSQGWRVFATARKDADIGALRAKGIEAHYLDYTQPQSIANLVDEVLRQPDGTLGALFNNGAYAQPGAIEDLPVEALRQQFEANFFGWHDLTRRVVPVMRRQGHGRIVHCSSILGLVPMKWQGAYVASKFALEGLMLAQRMELEGSGIDVSLIEPGPIASRFTYNAARHAEANIDMEASVHRELYQRQMAKLKSGGTKSKNMLGPEAVYAVLLHALEAPRPRPHYVVTRPAKLGSLARRLMPARWLYRMLSDQS